MFKEMFIEGSEQTLKWLRDTKDIRDEIQKLKKELVNAKGKKAIEIKNNIEYLESKLK
jgi:hypothetical protein